jgi:alkyl hydroperoxide reductase subunit AhpF
VIGGGNSGVEEGLFLAQFAERIRLVEFMPELGAFASPRHRAVEPEVHDPYKH